MSPCWYEGYNAYMYGYGIEVCPYLDLYERMEWEEGWYEAYDDSDQ